MFRALLFCFLIINGGVFAQGPIIPTPLKYQEYKSKEYFDGTLLVDASSFEAGIYIFFKKSVERITGLTVVDSADANAIKYETIGMTFSKKVTDIYSIKISDTEKTFSSSSDAGQFYAVISFLQLLQEDAQGWYVKHCTIGDYAKFEWRGLHLDVSRHFYSVDEVKRFIDLMALYKFNKFHWHLTDDQGWRIEIKKYPKLTEIGGYRDSTLIGHYSDTPRKWDTNRYGGFYTQDEIKDVVAYASKRFIDVVPEIEMPGHSRAALAAYPEYSCTGELNGVPGLWGVFEEIYCSKPETIRFMQDILSEVIELFPYKYIHIGGDEAPKTRWKACPNCQKVINENGLHDEHELQSHFISQMDTYLTSKGKRLIGWDEILEGGLSPNAAVMSWRGEAGGIEAAKQKHEVVMSPTTYCYFDYYQSASVNEPVAIGGFLPLEKVYKYNPIPADLPEEFHSYILGGQANLWTEYIPSLSHLEYMTYPRALALAQSLWCKNKPEYDDFLETYINYQEAFLEKNEVNFSRSIHYPIMELERMKDGVNLRFKGTTDSSHFNVFTKVSGPMSMTNAQVMGYQDSLYMERSDEAKDISYKVTSDDFEGELLYHFKIHSAVGLPIELITKPHPKYDHNGSLNLVDGIIAGDKWRGTDWLGFQSNRVEMVMDLLEERVVEEMNLVFLDQNGSWIYLPTSVKVLGSKNKKCWKKMDLKFELKDGNWMMFLKRKNVRYLKIEIEAMDQIPEGKGGAGNIPWTFINEIVIN